MAAENNINSSGSELSEKDKKFRDFALNGNLWKVIFYVCIPLSVFQLINHLFNILDTMMASHVRCYSCFGSCISFTAPKYD